MWGAYRKAQERCRPLPTFVRAWKYTEPDPLYGKYTTKEWTRYLIECQPDIEPADAFIYRNESFTLYSREELERLVGILHGNFSTDSVPVCSYSGHTVWNGRNFPAWEWNMLKADTHLFSLAFLPSGYRLTIKDI